MALVAVLAILVASASGSGVFAKDEGSGRQGPVAGTDSAGFRAASRGSAKNVIFMMGDGMAQAQRDAIQLSKVGPYNRLVMDQLPYEGMQGTNSADPETFVTDSAAAATSMASGVKTYNGAINYDNQGNRLTSIMKQAKAQGKSIGVVTTSQVTDASPAAFGGASVKDRGEQSEIARQFIEDVGVDVVLGGGEDRWYPAGDQGAYPDNPPKDPTEESSSNRGNLVRKAQNLGYQYVSDPADLGSANGKKILGLFANEEMFEQRPEGKGDIYAPDPTLPEMTRKAISVLSKNDKGFVLFVEEGAIDEMGHNNNGRLVIKSGKALDKTVSDARYFAAGRNDTLMMVTGDHECGGLTVEEPSTTDENGDEIPGNISGEDGPFDVANSDYQFYMDWTTTGHTGVDVPLTAMGPGAEQLTGNYENTHIHGVMARTLGFPVTQQAANNRR
jgi:alkaline phosphatase